MTKTRNKIIATILLTLIVMTNILPVGVSFAVNVGDSVGLTSVGDVPLHLKSHALASGGYVKTSLAGYYENGVFYPAYCINKEKPGVDSEREYSVTLTEILGDNETYNKVWRTVTAGYPYNSPESLGVSDWRYAYQATKMAVYCVLGQSDLSKFYATDTEGQQIVDLIHRLVATGNNGTNTYRTPVASVNKSGNMQLNGNYYIQNYSVGVNVDISSYEVIMTGFPVGTKITNTAGADKHTFASGEIFQVRIPKDKVETQDINGKIRIDVTSRSMAVFYGTSFNSEVQDYAVTGDPIALTSTTANINLKGNTASIRIKKIDSDTKQPIKDTIYELTKEDGTVIGRGTTDSSGNLTFYELYQGNYVLKEIKSNDDYIISQEKIDIRATYNKMTNITLENKHKTGNLKVYKVDKDNNKITLGNVEFDLFSEEFGKVIGTYTTDVNGEILVKNLRTGNYKWIEKTTNKWYNLTEDTNIKVEWEKTNESTIENELKKGQIRVIKIDKDNNEVKLKGVKFNVLDVNGNILETIITNDEGEATTSRYAIRDFEKITLQEIETLQNYVLNETPQTAVLKYNEITNLTFENEKKKGQIKVIKVDLDNNEVKLPNVEFEVLDESGKVVDTLITDKNGETVSKRLPIDQQYTVKEKKTLELYVLNEETQTVTLKENQITDIIFENEKKKGQIKVIKIDLDNNEVKIPNVEFNVLDEKGNIVDTLITDENGETTSIRLPIDQEYQVIETKTLQNYVLNETPQTAVLKYNEITNLTFENEKKKGQIEITKTSKDDNELTGEEKGTLLKDAIFEIYTENNELVDTVTISKNGKGITKLLEYRKLLCSRKK